MHQYTSSRDTVLLKIYQLFFVYHRRGHFRHIADWCHNEPSKYDLACHKSPSSSVVYGRPWVWSHACNILNIYLVLLH